MKLALTSTTPDVTFGPILLRTPFETAFSTASERGCDGVELHLRHPGLVDGEEILRLMDRYGLEVPTIGTGLAAGMDGLTFTDPDPEIRRQAVERIEGQISLAARLGAAVIIGFMYGRLGGIEAELPVRAGYGLAALAECCRSAEQRGVTLLLEPINRYENDHLNTIEEALEVIERVGAPNLKVLADTFHMNIEEVDLGRSLIRAGAGLGHVHLADSNRRAPGHGHLDLAGVLSALADIRYDGYLAFEVLPLPDPLTAVRDATGLVRRLLSENVKSGD